jgi:hypothetical protein
MKKNIILLIYSLNGGGAENTVSKLSFLLSDYYNLKVVVFQKSKNSIKCGCKIYNLSVPSKNGIANKFLVFFKRIIKLKKFKKKNKIDITISFLPTVNIINLLSKVDDKIIVTIRS